MNNPKLARFNTLATGIITGTVIPLLVYFILYYSKIQDVRVTLFSNHLVISNIIPVIISHCVLPNLIFFMIFNGLDWLKAAKGILATTIVMTVLLFAIKLIYSLV